MYNTIYHFLEKWRFVKMFLVREITREIYNVIKGTFKYSFEEAEIIDHKLKDEKVKAKDVPLKSYIAKKGASLQLSMAMLYMLKLNGIESYIGIYKGESMYTDQRKGDYAVVIYHESLFGWYVADFEPQNPNYKIKNPERIALKKFRKLKGKIWVYNPYDKHFGNLPIFGGFLQYPKKVIK